MAFETTEEYLQYYNEKYGNFRVQYFLGRPLKWVNYGTKEYEEYAKDLGNETVNNRERMPDEVVYDIEAPKHKSDLFGKRRDKIVLETAKEIADRLKKVWKLSYNMWWSGGTGIHCLPQKTKIVIKDYDGFVKRVELRSILNRLKKEKEVYILTPNGFKRIKNGFKRKLNKDERLIYLRLNNGLKLKLTEDHTQPVLREGKLINIKAKNIKITDKIYRYVQKQEWGNTRSGDYYLGRFLGLYLAEGNKRLNRTKSGIYFTFGPKEHEYANLIAKIIHSFGGEVNIRYYKNCIRCSTHSRAIRSFVEEFINGTSSKDKRLKTKAFGKQYLFRKGIIDGYFEGDGDASLTATTVSKGIAQTIIDLGATCGLYITLHSRIKDGKKYYITHICSNSREQSQKYVSIKDKHYLKRDIYVIDIEIDSKDHLFCLSNGLVTHNCHIFFPELVNYNKYDRQSLKHALLKKIGYGFLGYSKEGDKGKIDLQNTPWIQLEQAKHRKGGTKTLIEENYIGNNLIPKVVLDEFQEMKKKAASYKPVEFKTNDKPSCIKYLEYDDFRNLEDGRHRACFILAAYYANNNSMNKTRLYDYLRDWNRDVCRGHLPDAYIKSQVDQVFNNIKNGGRRMGCNFRKNFLTDLGMRKLCMGCQFMTRKKDEK